MAAHEEFTMVKKIVGDSDFCIIKVKVLLLWNSFYQDNPTVRSSIDMVLEDEKEGGAFIISNFGVALNSSNFKVVDNDKKINFYKATIVQPTSDFHSSDVLGKVVSSDDVKLLKIFGREKKLLKCELQDLRHLYLIFFTTIIVVRKCHVHYGMNLHLSYKTSYNKVLWTTIQWSFLFNLQSSTPSMNQLRHSLSSNTVASNPENYFNNYEVKYIDELFDVEMAMDWLQ